MTLYKPELVSGHKVPMNITNARRLLHSDNPFNISGSALQELGEKTGANAVSGAGTFQQTMLNALDAVSQEQMFSTGLMQDMITDPDSVDAHDVTTAMAKAYLSLNISRTILDRIVKGWKELVNMR